MHEAVAFMLHPQSPISRMPGSRAMDQTVTETERSSGWWIIPRDQASSTVTDAACAFFLFREADRRSHKQAQMSSGGLQQRHQHQQISNGKRRNLSIVRPPGGCSARAAAGICSVFRGGVECEVSHETRGILIGVVVRHDCSRSHLRRQQSCCSCRVAAGRRKS